MNHPLRYPTSRLAWLSLVAAVLTACGGGAGVDGAAGTNASDSDLSVQATRIASGGSTVEDAAKTLRGTVLSTTAPTINSPTHGLGGVNSAPIAFAIPISRITIDAISKALRPSNPIIPSAIAMTILRIESLAASALAEK